MILPLVGTLAVWMGIMRLAERSGLVELLARALQPVMRFLFPDVPPEHPAMGAMVMNVAANMLGLGNAATPMGLKAMEHLERLNPRPGTATNAMCTFLAINTSSVQLIPATVVALLAAKGAREPTAIVGTALVATSCACVVGVTSAKLLQKLPVFALPPLTTRQAGAEQGRPGPDKSPEATPPVPPMVRGGWIVLAVFALCVLAVFVHEAFFTPRHSDGTIGSHPLLAVVSTISLLAIPLMLAFFPLYAALRGLKVYSEFVEGAREGVQVALQIVPFLISMLMAIGMFRGSGGLRPADGALPPVSRPDRLPGGPAAAGADAPVERGRHAGDFRGLAQPFLPGRLDRADGGDHLRQHRNDFLRLGRVLRLGGRAPHPACRRGWPDGRSATGVIVSVFICRLMFGGTINPCICGGANDE